MGIIMALEVGTTEHNDAVHMIFILFAISKHTTMIPKIPPKMPNHQSSPSVFFPGMGIFMPNKLQRIFKGTRIVAMNVSLLRASMVLVPATPESTESCAR